MTEAEAKTKLALMVLSDEDPTLDAGQLADILTYARRPDADDLDYSDAGWAPTWNLDAAAAEGWLRKAGLAAARFDFAEDGQRFNRAQIYEHCIKQANHYARRSMGSVLDQVCT